MLYTLRGEIGVAFVRGTVKTSMGDVGQKDKKEKRGQDRLEL